MFLIESMINSNFEVATTGGAGTSRTISTEFPEGLKLSIVAPATDPAPSVTVFKSTSSSAGNSIMIISPS